MGNRGMGTDIGKGNGEHGKDLTPLPPLARGACCFWRWLCSPKDMEFLKSPSIGGGIIKSKTGGGPGPTRGGRGRGRRPKASRAPAAGSGRLMGGCAVGLVGRMGGLAPSTCQRPPCPPREAGTPTPSKSRIWVVSDLESGGRSPQTRVNAGWSPHSCRSCLHNASTKRQLGQVSGSRVAGRDGGLGRAGPGGCLGGRRSKQPGFGSVVVARRPFRAF